MKIPNPSLLAAVAVALLAACRAAPEPAPAPAGARSASWYEEHDAERLDQLARCRAAPAALEATPDCANAHRAANDLAFSPTGLVGLAPLPASAFAPASAPASAPAAK